MMIGATLAVALATLPGAGGVASAQEVGACASDGCIIDMAPPIYVLNNQWANNNYGWGSITVHSPTSWSTSWDFAPPSDWTVIAYPSAILGWQWGNRFPNAQYPTAQTGLPVQLSSHTPINTAVAFNIVPDPSCQPGGVAGGGTGSRVCRLDVTYDMWLHDTATPGTSDPQYELMIWLAYSRELFSGTTPTAYATLAGHNWKIIRTQGGGSPVAAFLLDEPADLTAAALNITEFTDWLVANQWVPATWWIDSVQFGTEIDKGKGTLNVTEYSVTVGGPMIGGPMSINAGGEAVAPFVADVNFSGGTAATYWTGAIDTSGVAHPAPQTVYQSERYGAMTYTIPGLIPGGNYTLRLHFAENYFTSAGQRTFNVAINGTPVLNDFDVIATAGAAHRAHVEEYTVTANDSGQIGIAFTNVVNYALINGIEVLDGFPSLPAWAAPFIRALYRLGITGGCAPNDFCPDAPVTRAEMAVFLLTAQRGAGYTPPSPSGQYGDVPPSYWAAAWIEQLTAVAIAVGCGRGNFCPDAPVTRAEAAVFLLRARHGSAYVPPAPAGRFTDVPPSYWAAAWIEQFTAEGITRGCGATTYCPGSALTRAQLAVFLVRTFGLEAYAY